jgi:hypothetical protein
MAIVCMIFALLLVNAVCYNFLMHVIGHIALRWALCARRMACVGGCADHVCACVTGGELLCV